MFLAEKLRDIQGAFCASRRELPGPNGAAVLRAIRESRLCRGFAKFVGSQTEVVLLRTCKSHRYSVVVNNETALHLETARHWFNAGETHVLKTWLAATPAEIAAVARETGSEYGKVKVVFQESTMTGTQPKSSDGFKPRCSLVDIAQPMYDFPARTTT
ncbi:hypothetical protein BC830DRAFT_1173056 [Chytriomyces sp. MP71]|nr:hypothetical protein BC830DRAFT_1173056 [Chytriomyces sp. MP71]